MESGGEVATRARVLPGGRGMGRMDRDLMVAAGGRLGTRLSYATERAYGPLDGRSNGQRGACLISQVAPR